jgi:arginine repressor
MLRKLIERGWTQEAIAEELKARGAGGKLRQTTISRVLREDSCRWELGKAIERLYYDVCERERLDGPRRWRGMVRGSRLCA